MYIGSDKSDAEKYIVPLKFFSNPGTVYHLTSTANSTQRGPDFS